jgi:hypothetical protein
MIATRRLQRSFADGFITQEVTDLWEPWMRQTDQVLEDDALLTLIQQEMAKRLFAFAAPALLVQRGELQFSLPVGYVWTAQDRIEKEPDQRVQQALALVFTKMTELSSVRQVLLWFHREGTSLTRKNQDQP